MNRILPVLSFGILIACKKEQSMPKTVANLTNNVSGGLNYKFYFIEDDYLDDKNALVSCRADSGVATLVNLDAAKNNGHVYFDVYTDDFSISNWTRVYEAEVTQLQLDSTLISEQGLQNGGVSRSYYLEGNKRETRWHAVDVLEFGQSIWDP